MSVVLVADVFETVREVIGHLSRQTIVDRLELVLIVPSEAKLALDEETCGGFHSLQVVEVGSLGLLQPARAAGARAARAEVLFFGETHCFPEPGSLEALLDRHREPWAIVGQVMCNGNPTTRISWSNMLMDYGRELEGMPGGPVDHLPSHNSSYKRQVLLDLGDELEHLFETGDTLNDAIVDRGGRLYLDERSRTHHLNVTRSSAWLRERLAAGRGYAGRRAEDWALARRAAYALTWPLIGVVRLVRIRRCAERAGLRERLFPGIYPVLILGLTVASFGELLGYCFGVGSGLRVVSSMELHRRQLLRAGDPTYPDL